MKKLLFISLFLIIFCGAAYAETAAEYAAWLEMVLPNASFADAEIPEFITRVLGADYEFIARTDETYGDYIAGVRRANAPALPEDAHQSSYSGTFETRIFRAEDNAGNIYYDFILADGVYMCAYDGLTHLIIWIDPAAADYSDFQKMFSGPNSLIFNAANPQYRAQIFYAADHGFAPEDTSRCQMIFPVHSLESWQAGVTDQPLDFYLNMTPPEGLLGKTYLEEEELIQYTRIPIGIYLRDDGQSYELVLSDDGMLGVETDEPHRLYSAGPGCDALLDLAEKVLGYRPGKISFLNKTSISATLKWKGGQTTITSEESLSRLDAMFSKADFSVGSVNCPSPCFLTVEYSDGSSASMAVAINSYDLFFHNGLYFTAGNGELLEIFMMKAEEIYV